MITNPATQSEDNNHNRFKHILIYFSFPGHINTFLGQESCLTLHSFYLELASSSKMFNTSIATGTNPAVFQVYWLWSLIKIQVLWRASTATKCPCPTNSKEFSLFCSFVMVSSTARKAAKQWDKQRTTCYSTQPWETRTKKKRGGRRARVQLQVEASGSKQRIGCREELRGCRRLGGRDEKNPSGTENKQVPIHLPRDFILLLRGKNNSVLLWITTLPNYKVCIGIPRLVHQMSANLHERDFPLVKGNPKKMCDQFLYSPARPEVVQALTELLKWQKRRKQNTPNRTASLCSTAATAVTLKQPAWKQC